MQVRHNSGVGNGNAVIYTLYVNGVTTPLVATLVTGAVGDASNATSVAVASGSLINVFASKAVAIVAGGVSVMVSIEFV